MTQSMKTSWWPMPRALTATAPTLSASRSPGQTTHAAVIGKRRWRSRVCRFSFQLTKKSSSGERALRRTRSAGRFAAASICSTNSFVGASARSSRTATCVVARGSSIAVVSSSSPGLLSQAWKAKHPPTSRTMAPPQPRPQPRKVFEARDLPAVGADSSLGIKERYARAAGPVSRRHATATSRPTAARRLPSRSRCRRGRR